MSRLESIGSAVGKLRLLLPLLLIPVAAFAACGEESSDRDEIAEVIETALVKTDPDSCTGLMTQAYLEESFGSSGGEALESCESNAEAEESDNAPVDVSGIEVDGAKATAEVGLHGGELAGQTALFALVDEDGWRLDEFVRFTEFDREEVIPQMVEGFRGGETATEPEVVDCIAKELHRMSRPGLESMFLDGYQATVELYEACE